MFKRGHPKKKSKVTTVEIDILPLISVALIVLMGVFLLLAAWNFFESFIGVRAFRVVGECPYEASELAAGADIKKGDRVYQIDKDKAESDILSNCNYIKSVKVKKGLFGKIKFAVECYEPLWYLEISGDYYVLDGELRVLEETKNRARLYDQDLISLTLPNVKRAIVGEKLVFGSGEGEIDITLEIMDKIISSPAFLMISGADIDNRYDIHFEFDRLISSSAGGVDYTDIDGVFEVNIGSHQKLDAKLEYIVRALLDEDLTGACKGTIDVSDEGNKVSIRPIYVNE